jgi:hypothetical protein
MSAGDRKAALWGLVGVFLAAAVLLRPGIPAGIVGGLVGFAALIVKMQRPGASTGQRDEKNRFTASRQWECRKSVDLDQVAHSVANRARLRFQGGGARNGTRVVTMKGGSQLRTRLLGGYFINPTYLPVCAELDLDQSGKRGRLRLRVTDGFGRVALRDPRLRERFDLRVAEIESVTDGTLSTRASGGRNER